MERGQFGVLAPSPDRDVRASPFDFAGRLMGSIHVGSQVSGSSEKTDGVKKEKRDYPENPLEMEQRIQRSLRKSR